MAGDREAFLRRVREAAARGRTFPVQTLSEFPADVGYVGGGPDLVERFTDEFKAVGGHVHRAASDDDARAMLGRILSEIRATRTGVGATAGLSSSAAQPARDCDQGLLPCSLLWQHPLLERLGVSRLVEEAGFAVVPGLCPQTSPGGVEKERLFAAAVGISSVDWAVAETGTLVVAARPGQPRSVSLLPPVHVAVMAREQIVPDLFDLFAKLSPVDGRQPDQAARGVDLPSNLVLITGPSKTGDIELKLTTGVHGPGEVHVVVIE